jgi:hypothetical protein
VEVLVTCGILAALVGSLLLAFSTGGGMVRRGMETLDVVSTAGLALEHLKRDLRGLHGEIPLPAYSSPEEFRIEFVRFDGIDPSTGQARLTPITYHFWLQPDRRRTVLTRDVQGRRTVFFFERDVAFLIGSDATGRQAGPSAALAITFPLTAAAPTRRPPIRTTVPALNRGLPEPPPVPGQGPAQPPKPLPAPFEQKSL